MCPVSVGVTSKSIVCLVELHHNPCLAVGSAESTVINVTVTLLNRYMTGKFTRSAVPSKGDFRRPDLRYMRQGKLRHSTYGRRPRG